MKSKVVQIRVKKLNSLIEKFFGLISLPKESIIYFETRWGIHTFFVKHPINVYILDKEFHVVSMKKNLKPWKIFLWTPKHFRVVESYSSNTEMNGVNIGSKVSLGGGSWI